MKNTKINNISTNIRKKVKLSNLSHFLATGFASGLFFYIPGTFGSFIAAMIWYLFLSLYFYIIFLLVIFFGMIVGIYCCHQMMKDVGINDHRCIVIDEFIGIWIVLTVLSKNETAWIVVGFLLFRLLDIWKPYPICLLNKTVKRSFDIFIDDIFSGIVTALSLLTIKYFFLSY